jgi:hypothetical protein
MSTTTTPVTPHPYGRVFTCGIGTYPKPIADSWVISDELDRIWLAKRPRKLCNGDHVFAIAAGRGSRVVGLFEVTDNNPVHGVPQPWEPGRWQWSVAAKPLTSVAPTSARSVAGITAPRGFAQRIADPETRAALYDAMA